MKSYAQAEQYALLAEKCVECTIILWPAKDHPGAGLPSCRPRCKRTFACGAHTKRPPEERPVVQQARKDARKRLLKEQHSSGCTSCFKSRTAHCTNRPGEPTAMNGWELQSLRSIPTHGQVGTKSEHASGVPIQCKKLLIPRNVETL